MIGLAVGAAIEGMRPIIEMQFADFSTVGFNQIVNQAATLHWRTRVPCPITVRLPGGGTSGSGPFHSQSMEALYAHYPGLVVMTPATVEDAYSMLLEAVAIDETALETAWCDAQHMDNDGHTKQDIPPATRRRFLATLDRYGFRAGSMLASPLLGPVLEIVAGGGAAGGEARGFRGKREGVSVANWCCGKTAARRSCVAFVRVSAGGRRC